MEVAPDLPSHVDKGILPLYIGAVLLMFMNRWLYGIVKDGTSLSRDANEARSRRSQHGSTELHRYSGLLIIKLHPRFLSFFPALAWVFSLGRYAPLSTMTLMALNVVLGRDIPGIQLVSTIFQSLTNDNIVIPLPTSLVLPTLSLWALFSSLIVQLICLSQTSPIQISYSRPYFFTYFPLVRIILP